MENLSVVLVEARNPLNIGAAARAMANFGFPDLRLVNPYRVAADEARSGPHADQVLLASRDFSTLAGAIADATLIVGTSSATKRDVRLPIHRLEDAATLIRAHSGPVSLLFGSEKFGLSNDDMTHCHFLVRIPTVDNAASMNLGQAVAVTLFELARRDSLPIPTPSHENLAPAAMLDELTNRFYEALQLSGYVHHDNVIEKLRQLFRRMRLREHDAVMWLGMARQLLWRLKRENKII
jgi:TrmH family RNA methyltransferase